VLLASIYVNTEGHSEHEKDTGAPAQVLAPGYQALNYPAPAAGSYALPPLDYAADGEARDADGRPVTLHGVFDDRVVVLSFIYTGCDDVNGCPLATYVLSRLREKMTRDPQVGNAARLVRRRVLKASFGRYWRATIRRSSRIPTGPPFRTSCGCS
jgi:cytochrome c peroxidase